MDNLIACQNFPEMAEMAALLTSHGVSFAASTKTLTITITGY